MNPQALQALHDAIAAVCPMVGISVGDPADKATWRIDFEPGATEGQRAAAQAVMAVFDAPKARLRAYAAQRRWEIETGGITLDGGARIATAGYSQRKIAEAKTAFDNGTLTGAIQFKGENGWFAADSAIMTSVYEAVVAHVQAGYAVEKTICDGIEAGTITDEASVDAAFSLTFHE